MTTERPAQLELTHPRDTDRALAIECGRIREQAADEAARCVLLAELAPTERAYRDQIARAAELPKMRAELVALIERGYAATSARVAPRRRR